MHGGERGHDLAGEFQIVESGDRQLLRHGDALPTAFDQRPEGELIVAADDCRGRLAGRDQGA